MVVIATISLSEVPSRLKGTIKVRWRKITVAGHKVQLYKDVETLKLFGDLVHPYLVSSKGKVTFTRQGLGDLGIEELRRAGVPIQFGEEKFVDWPAYT